MLNNHQPSGFKKELFFSFDPKRSGAEVAGLMGLWSNHVDKIRMIWSFDVPEDSGNGNPGASLDHS